ncbi:MAG: hypothetical protein KatS3mg050_1424 [Litorilinea sp.]|nr:MAG: hypothetical protein KatS3mg050_1424 [Litorilinea sp.]
MTNQKRVTIVEVARRARVSAGTVSNALTGKRPVSPATRARILRAIEELGYQPNLLARGLVNRRSGTLGVVVSGLEYYGPSRTLVGIEREANQLGYSLILDLLHTPEADNVEHVLGILTSRRVDGIIWAVHEVGENRAWVSEERLHRLPPIIFLTMGFRPGVAVVTADNRRGACLATRHLLDEGRRRIGLITGPSELVGSPGTAGRLAGHPGRSRPLPRSIPGGGGRLECPQRRSRAPPPVGAGARSGCRLCQQ